MLEQVDIVISTIGRFGLANAIASALSQSHSACRVVVVADGPCPEARRIFDRATAGETPLKVRYEELPAKAGHGGDPAKHFWTNHPDAAPWIKWLDDDDTLSSHCVSTMLAAAEPDTALVLCRLLILHAPGGQVLKSWSAPEAKLARYHTGHGAAMIRTEHARGIPYRDCLDNDYLYLCDISQRGTVKTVQFPLYIYNGWRTNADRVVAKPPGPAPKILVVILSHNQPASVDALYQSLHEVFDIAILDSGSIDDKHPASPHISCPNLYWGGCWTESIRRWGAHYDLLWIIGGDVTLQNDPRAYLDAITTAWPFGAWSPAINGRRREIMAPHAARGLTPVHQLEGIAFAVNTAALIPTNGFPEALNLGWGCDIIACHQARKLGLRVLLDGRVTLHHPPGIGYSQTAARAQMDTYLPSAYGPDWRRILHYDRDDPTYNRA